jgi:predicted ester cyclase
VAVAESKSPELGEMATSLTLDEMKRFIRNHFDEFVNKKDAAVIRRNMTPDFVGHDGPGGKPTDVEGDEQMMIAMYQAAPDLRVTIEELIAEGDKVMCRNVWRWTDPASRRKMQFDCFVLWRFEGNRIAERWATVISPAEGVSWTEPAGPLLAINEIRQLNEVTNEQFHRHP